MNVTYLNEPEYFCDELLGGELLNFLGGEFSVKIRYYFYNENNAVFNKNKNN